MESIWKDNDGRFWLKQDLLVCFVLIATLWVDHVTLMKIIFGDIKFPD